MLNRRQFLETSLKGSSLIAFGSLVPNFLAAAANVVPPGKDTILVVLEMTGGNDGLNTVIPYADDHYQKARSSLRHSKNEVIRVDDAIGLNPGLRSFEKLLGNGQLAIVQGVGYPNPNRSHFESMKIWQSADPKLKIGNGWLGRSLGNLRIAEGQIPGAFVGTEDLPLAMQGSATGVPTINPSKPYDLNLGGQAANSSAAVVPQPTLVKTATEVPSTTAAPPKKELTPDEKRRASRRQLIQDLTRQTAPADNSMLQFVQRSALQTYTSIDRLREITNSPPSPEVRFYPRQPFAPNAGELGQNLNLIARMIQAEFGTRVYYVSVGSFDHHSNQREQHQQLLQQLADAVGSFYDQLEKAGQAQRVLLMTFSEFGRRVEENSSKGTDHGAASCLFLAGPGAKGGLVGAHPSLANLDDGDMKYHTDFRQVYATLLDRWLECDSQKVLGAKFPHVPLLKKA